jgi:hypothetical protein
VTRRVTRDLLHTLHKAQLFHLHRILSRILPLFHIPNTQYPDTHLITGKWHPFVRGRSTRPGSPHLPPASVQHLTSPGRAELADCLIAYSTLHMLQAASLLLAGSLPSTQELPADAAVGRSYFPISPSNPRKNLQPELQLPSQAAATNNLLSRAPSEKAREKTPSHRNTLSESSIYRLRCIAHILCASRALQLRRRLRILLHNHPPPKPAGFSAEAILVRAAASVDNTDLLSLEETI